MGKEAVNDRESILMSHLKYLKAEMKGRMLETLSKTVIRRRSESVQVPKNWTRGQKSIRTGPRTARKSWSVLELDPVPIEASSEF